MIKIQTIIELVQVMQGNDIRSLELKDGHEEIRIELSSPLNTVINNHVAEDFDYIFAPILGIGYLSSVDGQEPFVCVGDKVKEGDVLCIIEAMKVMNEITADYDCEIIDICFENGKIVEFGQPLLKIKRIGESNAP